MGNLMEDFLMNLKLMLKSYADEITKITEQTLDEIDKIDKDKNLDPEEAYERINELQEELEIRETEIQDNLADKIIELARKYNLELTGGVFAYLDSHTIWSGMGFSHTSIEYRVLTIKISPTKLMHIYCSFTESKVYGSYKLTFDGITTEETPLISETTTPKTMKIIKAIPWDFIRPTWEQHIQKWIKEIAEAEIVGEFDRKIEEIKRKLEPNLWIYDYRHFYSALNELTG